MALGGPAGAIAGAAAGPVMTNTLRHVGHEVGQRLLSPREEARVGTVFVLTANEVRERLDAGEVQRTDGFFDEGRTRRSTAEEITEGVFLAAQREYEERKLPYLATLLASFVFATGLDRAQAVALLRAAQTLSYCQICLIAFYRRIVDNTEIPRIATAVRQDIDAVAMLIAELADLSSRGFVISSATWDGGVSFFGPAKSDQLTRIGDLLYSLMRLDRIPTSELDEILQSLLHGTPADKAT